MFKRAIIILATITLLAPVSSFAVPILPGDAAFLAGTSVAARPELAGEILVDELKSFVGTDSFGNVYFSGTLQVRIVKEFATGTMDFYYRISNDASSTDGIARISLTDFTGWATDVDFRTDGLGSVAPYYADRQASGGTVSFNFTNFPGTPGLVDPGTESFFIFIKTNATSFTSGSAVLLDGGRAAVDAYAPAVPEPSTLLLLGSALIGVSLVTRKYRRS